MKSLVYVSIFAGAMLLPSVALADASTEQKTVLQASLQRSIDRNLVEGAFLQMNFETGEYDQFYPVETHPMIIQTSNSFVMCSDLKRADGTSVTVDYYMAKRGERYIIAQRVIDNRAPLKAMIKAGKAKRLK